MTPPPFLLQMNQAVSEFWSARNERERKQILLAAAVAVLGLVYMLLIEPAYLGRAQLKKSMPELRLQAAQMQALSNEARALANVSVPPVPDMTQEIVAAALTRNGLQSQNIAVTGGLAKVQLSSVSFGAIVSWLDDLQKTARVSVLDANIVALEEADSVNATITLRQQKSE